MFGKWSWDVFVVLVLLLVGEIDGGLWITLPSAQDDQGGCGSLQSNSYFWDTQNPSYPQNNPINFMFNDFYSQKSLTVPKGDYYFFYYSANPSTTYYSDVKQYFCTGNVDSMPVGSYCFYQNIQNSQSCPDGFSEGTRTQDDEDTNNQSGPSDTTITTLPKRVNTYLSGGTKIDTTKWFFCCGSGTPSNSISFDSIRSQLPDSFVLFQKGGSCQVINGRDVQTGYVGWDDENTINKNTKSGTLPDGDLGSDTKFYYCTYGPSFLPFPPTNLQLTQKTSTSAKISWTASSGVYYKIVLSSIIKQTNYQQTSFTLGSLTPSIYTVTVYSGKNNPSGGAETYETVGISIQFKICAPGYDGVNCDPICNPPCVHGNCTAPNQCSCDTGSEGSTCECKIGYYPKNGNCLECNCNHGSCSDGPSGDGSCTCDTGYTTPFGTTQYCTICSDGYVMVDSNCIQCNPSCQTCDFNSTHCTSCKSGLIFENNICKSQCNDGSYYSGTCQTCLVACLTCYGGNGNQCLSCPNGKVLESGSCLSNCSIGNYPDQNNFCQGCQLPCSTCTGLQNGKCLSCVSPFVQNGTFCISENDCIQDGFVDSNRNCQKCDSTCSKCNGLTSTNCLECSNQKFLLNGACLDECPIGYFANPILNKCQGCSNGCSECFGTNVDQCLSCTSSLLLSSTSCVSSLECSTFGYKDNNLCLLCDSTCSKCNGPNSTNCLECSGETYLFNGECWSECPLGSFISGNQCQACTFPCFDCNSSGTNNCTSCVDNYSLNDTTCISNTLCLLNGYIQNGICQVCDSSCSTCYGSTSENCLSCPEPKYLLEGKCVDSCSLGYYLDISTKSCQRCDSSCLECSGEGNNNCLKCNPNYYSFNELCLIGCPTGYYQDTSSFHCQNCPQNCLSCTSETICTSCVSEYSLYEGECMKSCPNGFTSNNAICSQMSNQSQNKVGLGVGLAFLFIFLILLGLFVSFFIKRQKKKQETKLKEINMEASETFHSSMKKNDQFSSRTVLIQNQRTINEPGQATLLATQLEFEKIPGFLVLNFGLDFRIEKEIGKGGSGNLSICRILNEETKDMFGTELAVVKTLNQRNGNGNENENEYFFHEVSITWSLSFHANVVQLIGYCEEPRCILTKLYERDLFSLLHDPNEKIEASRIVALSLGIAEGIEKIHQIGISHRDLKSKNILIERGQTNKQEDIRAVICDFGLAVTMNNIKNAPSGLSPQYTPPEIFNSIRLKTSLDLKSYQQGDIFSFGVILWEIVTRKIPWQDFSFEDIEYAIRTGKRLEKIEKIDKSVEFLEEIIDSSWLENPQSRPTITSILQLFPKS